MAERILCDGSIVLLDDSDVDLWDRYYPWRRNSSGYAVTTAKACGRRTTVFLHKLIAERYGIVGRADHKNRNKLDDRGENLRPATKSQNGANQGLRRNNTSRFKGVTMDRDRFRARIKVNRESIPLGSFATEVEAARAYNAAAVRFFGEFACLNQV